MLTFSSVVNLFHWVQHGRWKNSVGIWNQPSKTGEGNYMHWCLTFPFWLRTGLQLNRETNLCTSRTHTHTCVHRTARRQSSRQAGVRGGDRGSVFLLSPPHQVTQEKEHGVRGSPSRHRPAPGEEPCDDISLSGVIRTPCILCQELKCEGGRDYIKLRILEEYSRFASELYRPFTGDVREK